MNSSWGTPAAALPPSETRGVLGPRVVRVAEAHLPTPVGPFRAIGYRGTRDGHEYIALVAGDVAGADVLVRIHSECLTGDALGSVRCDCGPQLRAAQTAVLEEGRGIILYLRGHEGRGIGLIAKLQAYVLQDQGVDTMDANLALGLPVDARDYAVAAEILRDQQVSSIRLLSNNPRKWIALRHHGVLVSEIVSLVADVPGSEANRYLATKRDRMGHLLPQLVEEEGEHAGR